MSYIQSKKALKSHDLDTPRETLPDYVLQQEALSQITYIQFSKIVTYP